MDIPDPVYRKLKARAVAERKSVEELILQSVQTELHGESRKPRQRVKLPIVASRRPGTLQIDDADIYKFIPFP